MPCTACWACFQQRGAAPCQQWRRCTHICAAEHELTAARGNGHAWICHATADLALALARQAAALSRLAALARRTDDNYFNTKNRCRVIVDTVRWNNWATALAAALTAALTWACNQRSRNYAGGTDASTSGGGGGGGGGAAGSSNQQQRMQQHMLQAAFNLVGAAMVMLLPAAAAGDADALERDPLPYQLDSLADFCNMTPETLQRHVQVLSLWPFKCTALHPLQAPFSLPFLHSI